ncbi:MAG: aldehyde dehydrogenase, partial [Candidatus Tectomicrobia bacterium]|nr:aldehyde dehydrogenase [Candidatus Tectomicrobia bacterium]
MLSGWTGNNLEIDLSKGKVEKRESSVKINETYLGGKGTNARLFWDRVPPEVAPYSPDNLLIIGTGVLTGTIVPSANRAAITFKSPQTGLHMYSAIGGFWPAEIKQAGYDTIIIRGRATTPDYLWISDDKVE